MALAQEFDRVRPPAPVSDDDRGGRRGGVGEEKAKATDRPTDRDRGLPSSSPAACLFALPALRLTSSRRRSRLCRRLSDPDWKVDFRGPISSPADQRPQAAPNQVGLGE